MPTRDRSGERAVAVADAMRDIGEIEAGGRARGGVDQTTVERVKQRLLVLAERSDLFTEADYPPPDAGGAQMYRIAQNDDDEVTLYVQSVGGGVSAPPHEHQTWAVIVGMHGQELNRLYGPCAGRGEPQVHDEIIVERGTGVAMLHDDVHSIHIDGTAINFHCYGLDLERLSDRRYWNAQDSEWQVFHDIGPIIEARPGHTSC